MNIIFKIMGPCHRVLENKINKNKDKIKNGLVDQVSKMNFNGLNMGFLGSLSTFSDNTVIDVNSNNKKIINSNKKDMGNEFNKLEKFFQNKKDKIIKLNSKTQEQTSELNKYILEDSKTKSIKLKNYEKQNAKIIIDDSINDFNNSAANNNFAVISDIEEPLDIILLNKQKTLNKHESVKEKEKENVEDFYNKMKIIEKKVNKSTVVVADDDLSSFINKTEMFVQENNYEVDSDDITSNNRS
jgi:C4-type Zn-finger protein